MHDSKRLILRCWEVDVTICLQQQHLFDAIATMILEDRLLFFFARHPDVVKPFLDADISL